jgi:hypothetical protein
VTTYKRRAHTRTVNGRTVQVRASGGASASPTRTYRKSTWVGATGTGVLLGGGKFAAVGLPNAGGVIGTIGMALIGVAAVMRACSR